MKKSALCHLLTLEPSTSKDLCLVCNNNTDCDLQVASCLKLLSSIQIFN